jgi:hypothetical protein
MGRDVARTVRENAYRILVGKPEVKRTLGKPIHRCENNIKIILTEIVLVCFGLDSSGSG